MATYSWALPTKQTNLLPGSGNTDAVTIAQLIANTSSPTGANASLQFNNSGVLGGSGNLTYTPVGGSTGGGLMTILGDITSTANITGNFFIGNGSLLTGIYGNTNVSNYLASGNNAANIVTLGNITGNNLFGNTASFGNASVSGNLTVLGNLVTANVTNITVANSLIQLASNNVTNIVDIGFYAPVNPGVQQYTGLVRDHTTNTWKLFSNVTTAPTSTVGFNANTVYDGLSVGAVTSTGNLTTTANISGSYILGNGALLTGLPATYGNANVGTYLNSGTNIGNVTTVGNVSATYILGNAAFMTGIPTGNYSNTNVISLLTTLTSNVTTTANVQANYFIGNGSQLTGLPSSYNDANVTTLLASGNVTTAITTTGNVNAGNLVITSRTRLGNVGNVSITGGNVNQVLSTDGAGNLTWTNQATVVPAVYFTAPATGNNQSFGNVILGAYANANVMTVFYNGALLENNRYTLSGPILTVNINLNVGDTIDVIAQTAGNVVNVISGYGDSNVSAYLAGGTNLTAINNGGAITAPTVTGVIVNTGANSLAMNGNRIYSQSSAITIDPTGDGSPSTGAVVVLGNLLVAGTLTYNDATSTVTSNLVYQAANSASTAGLASGGGLAVGPSGNSYATWLFNSGSNSWQSNLPITSAGLTATGALTGTTGAFTGNVSSSANLVAPTLVATNVNATTITASGNIAGNGIVAVGNISGSYFLGNGSQLTGIPALNSIIGGTSNVIIPVTNGNIDFNVGGSQIGAMTSTGLALPGTQTDLGNVGTTVNYNPTTNRLTKAPAMSAYAGFQAPFSGQLTNANMGQWIQASGDVTMPNTGTVPSGAVFTIYSQGISAQVPLTLSVFNAGTDFIYNPPAQDTGTTSLLMYRGQWAQLLSRGTGEWDIIASNLQEPFKVTTNLAAIDQVVGLDNLNFRVQSNLYLYTSPIAGSLTAAGSSLTMSLGDGATNDSFTSRSMSAGTWYQLTATHALGDDGDSIITIIQDQTNHRTYRVTVIRNSGVTYSITVERISG